MPILRPRPPRHRLGRSFRYVFARCKNREEKPAFCVGPNLRWAAFALSQGAKLLVPRLTQNELTSTRLALKPLASAQSLEDADFDLTDGAEEHSSASELLEAPLPAGTSGAAAAAATAVDADDSW